MNDSGSSLSPITGSPVVVNQHGVGNSAVGTGDDPYFVNNNELTGNSIVSKVLLGQENYAGWKRQMEIALSGRSKLSFIQGKYPKPDDAFMAAKWQRCNDVVMSWLICSVSEKIVEEILHAKDVMTAWEILESSYAGTNLARKFELQRELGNLVQGDLSVAMYKRKLESLWQELDALRDAKCVSANNCSRCKQVDEDCKSDRVIKFLMGLNDEYASVRTHVFALSEVPKFSTVYGLALSEEASRKARQISKVEGSALALTVQADQANNSQLNNGSSGQARQYSGQTRGRDTMRIGDDHYCELSPPPCELSKLPAEIITDIFSRLPAADLVKFRYLNKSYNSLIQSKCFIKLHLLKTAANINETHIWRVLMDGYKHPLLSIKVEALDKYLYLGLKLSDQSAGDVVARPFQVPVSYSITGSCNGLLCFCYSKTSKFLVCNPCTGAHKYYACDMVTGDSDRFPRRFDWVQFGFGDDGTGRFKIVRLGRRGGGSIKDDYAGQNTVEITIFTLGDSCFRKTEQMVPRMVLEESGLYLEGALHWVDWKDVKRGITVFSLGKEKFEPVMPLPPYDDDETLDVFEFKIICGKLTLSFNLLHRSGSSVFEIWVMEIYGVKESWSRKIALSGQSDDLFGEFVEPEVKLISILRNGSVFFTLGEGRGYTASLTGTPMVYDPKEKTFSIIECDPPPLFHATEYVETLVPPM